ncbi:zinc finger BED domain-containing protein RICESLEEPER 2-like [Humulus lupulus]|uniref:zinc finger BED domain-containing protein RICESLEEPER 2-like n=1 Tax=Humulus lupulus TaxID=3486 RepID=UPI002B4176E0|nr:zinc finger BED domain-containing protein RICESLEEPER 2-like [Humulus lupulus]
MTVARNVLKLNDEEKRNLKNILMNERVSITIDTWTSIQNLNYMVITAYWHDSIASIRHAVRYVKSSPARLKRFKEVVIEERIECKRLLCLDVQMRWNSTYLMLNIALKFQKAFESMESDANFLKHFDEVDKDGKKKEGPPTETGWENAMVFVKFLETFYEVTLRFSRSTYVTTDKYFIEICNMQRTLYRMVVEEDDPLLRSMAQSIRVKYDKYRGNIEECNEALIIVLVLDPRYKLKYLNYCFKAFYGPLTCAQMVNEPSMTQSHYKAQPSGFSSSSFTSTSSFKMYASLHDEFLQQRKEEDGGKTKNEVDRYLTEDVEPMIKGENFDILKWLAKNASKYKILSTIARDVLVIPVTTVASEAAFSTSGQILDHFMSSLSPKMAECLICLKNWWSISHQPIIVRDYMDEVEVLETSEILKYEITCDTTTAATGTASENVYASPFGSINAPSTHPHLLHKVYIILELEIGKEK